MSRHQNTEPNSGSGRKRGRKKQGDFSGESSETKRQRRFGADEDPKVSESQRTGDNKSSITKEGQKGRATFVDDQNTRSARKSRLKSQQTKKETVSRNDSGPAGRAGQRKRKQVPLTDSPEKSVSRQKIPRKKSKFLDDEDDESMDTSEDNTILLPDPGYMEDACVLLRDGDVSDIHLEGTHSSASSTRSRPSATNQESLPSLHKSTRLRESSSDKLLAKLLSPAPSTTRFGKKRNRKVKLPRLSREIEALTVSAYRERHGTFHQDSYGGPENGDDHEIHTCPDGPTKTCEKRVNSSTSGVSMPSILCAVCIVVLALWWRSVTLNATRQQNLKGDRAFRKAIADLSTTFGNQFSTLWKDLTYLRSSHFSAVALNSCTQPLVITLVGFQEDEDVVQCLSRKVAYAFSQGNLLEINGSSIDRYSRGNVKLGMDGEISSFLETSGTKVVYISLLNSLSFRDASIFFKYCDSSNTEHPEAVFLFSLTLPLESYSKINTSVQKTVVHEIDRYLVKEKWTDVAEEQSAALAVRLLDSAYFINTEELTGYIKSRCAVQRDAPYR